MQHRRRFRNGVILLGYILVAIPLGIVLPMLDVGGTMPGDRASQMLFTTGAGVVTFIGVVYSLLFLVVQFGTTTFTPRLNLFRDSAIVAHGFAFFTAVVIFSFTAAFSVGTDADVTILVPIVLVVLLLATLAMFRQIQATAFRSIQLSAVLEQVKERGLQVIDGVYPDTLDDGNADSPVATKLTGQVRELRWPGGSGVLQAIDVLELVHTAVAADVVFEWCAPIGDPVFRGDVLARSYGSVLASAETQRDALRALSVGPERTFEQDPRLVFRVLTDIALRALSPAVYDPTTATQALQATESLLRELMLRDLDIGDVASEDGQLRLRLVPPAWSEYVALATEELIPEATSSVQVRRYLEQMLKRLLEIAPDARRAALEQAMSSLPPALEA